MRQTKYYQGYGYVTTGGNIFSKAFDLVSKVVTKKAVTDAVAEAGKSFAKTAGTKAGEKLVDKIFKSEPQTVETMIEYSKEPVEKQKAVRVKPSNRKDFLKEIYGDGLLKRI